MIHTIYRLIPFVVLLALCHRAAAQPALPVKFDDLPKLASSWPKPWAALVNDLVPAQKDFEKEVLAKLDAFLLAEPPTKETYPLAEIVLAATLRRHESVRRGAPLAENPWQPLHTALQERLVLLRKEWFEFLRKNGDITLALTLADQWLNAATKDSPVRSAILGLWRDQAMTALEKKDYSTARGWLNRIEDHFDGIRPTDDAVAKNLRAHAESMLKEAQSQPDAQAIRTLEQALALWPRLPEARDVLSRRKGTLSTLLIAVPSLPEQLSPATAATVVEKQTLDLLFDRLYFAESQAIGKHYHPNLAAALATGELTASIPLRRDAYWSSGERLTASDIRHTARLMSQPDATSRSALWQEFLEVPRQESDAFKLSIGYRQGLLDPLAPLTFHVLPQYFHGKQLARVDDPDFAKDPVGSGPFQYAGRKVDGGKIHTLFRTNPHDLRGGARSIGEIRMTPWKDPAKDLTKPLPHMILDAPTSQIVALKTLGYVESRLEDRQAQFLAVNHRKPTLASAAMRRAIAHGLDRQALLRRFFRGDTAKEVYHTSMNGLTPRSSWATCLAPRVPDELYHAEQARLFASQAKKDIAAVQWTLKYPVYDARVQVACEEMARVIAALLQDAGIKADVQARGLSPRDLRSAIQERNFDLLYMSEEFLDDPVRVKLLFDPQADSTRAGGSNYLGYDSDVKLQELMSAALRHRQFSVVQTQMHAIHAHLYETMPVIPLWHLDVHVLVQSNLRTPPLDSNSIFARVREWKLAQ